MTDDSDDRRGAVGNAAVVLAVVGMALAAVAGVTFAGSGFADLGNPSGEAILDDAERQYESAETLVGAATVTVSNETTNRSYAVQFSATDDNQSRVSVTGENGTIVAGTNGTVAWVHDPETGVTRVYENESYDASELNESQNETLEDALDRLRNVSFDWTDENTTATREGKTTVGGTAAWIVEVEPTNESRDGVVTYWVGVNSSKVLKAEYAGENGTVTIRYTETRFDVAVANSTFQPPGVAGETLRTVETFDALQNATQAVVPELTDSAYKFTEGRVLRYGGETAVAEYDGPNAVTVVTTTADRLPFDGANATQVEIAGVTANVTERDGRVIVTWAENGVRVAVVTDADRETAVALAESLVGTAAAPDDSERLTARHAVAR